MNKTIKIFCLCFFTTVFLVGCEQQNPPVNNNLANIPEDDEDLYSGGRRRNKKTRKSRKKRKNKSNKSKKRRTRKY